ncbi:MAG: hypothetical protein ACFFC7_33260 [Candidatus Hermodarchaeota archaeon]
MSEIELSVDSPGIVVVQWIPMGKNNMVSFNRHLGAHKKYGAPTEFGMHGAVEDVRNGTFEMRKSGVFVYTVSFSFSDYVKAHLKTSLKGEDTIGMRLDKDGLASLGVEIIDKQLTFDQAKILIGKLTYRSVDYLFPILSDVQQALLSTLNGVEDILNSHFSVTTYALIVTESLGVEFNDTNDFLEKYPFKIGAITDWIIDHKSINNCHIFIGMRAAVCVGKPSKHLQFALQNMLFQKSVFNASLRLFSLIWTLSKQIKQFNAFISEASYKQLKELNLEIGRLKNQISLLGVLDETLSIAIDEKKQAWENSEAKTALPANVFKIEESFDDEKDKSSDRDLNLKQLVVDLEGLGSAIEQRMDFILTKNSENLNLLVLAFTVISVIGIAEIFYFDLPQWAIVLAVLVPFGVASLLYIRSYLRNFR